MSFNKTKKYLNKKESNFIAMLLLGNNIALVFFGLFAAEILDPIISGWGVSTGVVLFLQTIFSTILVLIVAEFLPKAFVQINPNGFLVAVRKCILLTRYLILFLNV